jgi:hypothetical protein
MASYTLNDLQFLVVIAFGVQDFNDGMSSLWRGVFDEVFFNSHALNRLSVKADSVYSATNLNQLDMQILTGALSDRFSSGIV